MVCLNLCERFWQSLVRIDMLELIRSILLLRREYTNHHNYTWYSSRNRRLNRLMQVLARIDYLGNRIQKRKKEWVTVRYRYPKISGRLSWIVVINKKTMLDTNSHFLWWWMVDADVGSINVPVPVTPLLLVLLPCLWWWMLDVGLVSAPIAPLLLVLPLPPKAW